MISACQLNVLKVNASTLLLFPVKVILFPSLFLKVTKSVYFCKETAFCKYLEILKEKMNSGVVRYVIENRNINIKKNGNEVMTSSTALHPELMFAYMCTLSTVSN